MAELGLCMASQQKLSLGGSGAELLLVVPWSSSMAAGEAGSRRQTGTPSVDPCHHTWLLEAPPWRRPQGPQAAVPGPPAGPACSGATGISLCPANPRCAHSPCVLEIVMRGPGPPWGKPQRQRVATAHRRGLGGSGAGPGFRPQFRFCWPDDLSEAMTPLETGADNARSLACSET